MSPRASLPVPYDQRHVVAERTPRSGKAAAGRALAHSACPGHDEAASLILGQGTMEKQATPRQRLARKPGGDSLHLDNLHVPASQ